MWIGCLKRSKSHEICGQESEWLKNDQLFNQLNQGLRIEPVNSVGYVTR
ncbi:MAG: hypothetical protein ACJATR_001458 [Halopseudomonas sp.]|jgi:hypothetical protein